MTLDHFCLLFLFVGLIAGVLAGFPIGFLMAGLALSAGYLGMGDGVFYQLTLIVGGGVMKSYALSAIPLFIFMGSVFSVSGMSVDLYEGLGALLHRFRSGLAVATLILGVLIAASSGIVGAAVAATGLVALPPMIAKGHSKAFTCGLVLAGGGMAATVPPSILTLIYAPVAGVPVVKLFMASLIPSGILLGFYLIYAIARMDGALPTPVRSAECGEASSGEPSRKILTYVIPTVLVILAVIGSMFYGFARPLEAGGLGVTGVMIMAVLHRKMNFAILESSLLYSIKATSLILWVVLGATLFSGVFIKLGGDRLALQLVARIGGGEWVTLSAMVLIIVMMGTFMECVGTILVLAPIYLPILKLLGFSELWFGVLFCLALGTAHFTPPVSVAVVILKGVAPRDIPLTTMYRGVTPFFLIQMLTMGMVAFFPQIALWLPGLMVK